MELNPDKRRKRFKVWISDEERILLEAKAEYYGYKDLSPYIRDAAIYEKVTYVNLKHKKELYDAYAENTKELKEIAKDIRHIAKFATQIPYRDRKELLSMLSEIFKKQREIMKVIENKLDLEVWYEINRNRGVG